MTDLFGHNSIPETRKQYLRRKRKEERTSDGAYRNNPMLEIHGETPGKKCRDCKFLCVREFAKRYYKCEHRGCSASPATDHRVNWPACGLYEYSNVKL
jgi:hypothetical protein